MVMRKLSVTRRILHTIYENMPGHSLPRPSRIAVTSTTHGGSKRTLTCNHRTAVAEYYIGVRGPSWGRRGLFGLGILLRAGQDQIRRTARMQCDTGWKR